MNQKRSFDLEDRLISFASAVLEFVETLPKTQIGKYFSDQLSRSSVGSALNYGEAQAAESRRDFIHKMLVVLKELRESNIAMKITSRKRLGDQKLLAPLLDESSELVAIFTTSVKTARTNK